MVVNIEPVADVQAVAVNGKFFIIQGVINHQRNHFFGELIFAVIVRAACNVEFKAPGMAEGFDEMVSGGFAGGIRRIGT